MASIRRGYSDDFVIKNNKVGIGASNPQESLDVVGGALQGQDLKVTGVSTQTAFSGFLRADHQIAENIEFSNINVSSLSGEIIVGNWCYCYDCKGLALEPQWLVMVVAR